MKTETQKFICDKCKYSSIENEFFNTTGSGPLYICPKCNSIKVSLTVPASKEQQQYESHIIRPYKEDISDEAKEFLANPDLLTNTVIEVNKFVAGEQDSILTIGLNACGRLVMNAAKTSYNIIPNDDSGAGKDYVTKATLLTFVPKHHLEMRSRISPTAFNYWHTKESEPNWNWDGKVLYLSDVSDVVLNSEVMKVFTSDDTKALIVKDQKAIELEIVGKPVLFATTANSAPGQEQLRRFSLMPMDSSIEQTNRIKSFITKIAVTGKKPLKNKVVEDAMKGLDRVNVVVPFGETLCRSFPNLIIARTAIGSFIDLIKASAALYQYQRARTTDDSIIATFDDYEYARQAFTKLTSGGSLVPLTKTQKHVLEVIDRFLDCNVPAKEMKTHDFWAVKEIEQKVSTVTTQGLYKILDHLAENKFLERGEKPGMHDALKAFKIVERDRFVLPTREELEREVSSGGLIFLRHILI